MDNEQKNQPQDLDQNEILRRQEQEQDQEATHQDQETERDQESKRLVTDDPIYRQEELENKNSAENQDQDQESTTTEQDGDQEGNNPKKIRSVRLKITTQVPVQENRSLPKLSLCTGGGGNPTTNNQEWVERMVTRPTTTHLQTNQPGAKRGEKRKAGSVSSLSAFFEAFQNKPDHTTTPPPTHTTHRENKFKRKKSTIPPEQNQQPTTTTINPTQPEPTQPQPHKPPTKLVNWKTKTKNQAKPKTNQTPKSSKKPAPEKNQNQERDPNQQPIKKFFINQPTPNHTSTTPPPIASRNTQPTTQPHEKPPQPTKNMLTNQELVTNRAPEKYKPKLDLKPPPKETPVKKMTKLKQKPKPDKANSPKIADVKSFLAKKRAEREAKILAASLSPDPGQLKSSTSGNDRAEQPTIIASSGHTLPIRGEKYRQ